MPLAINRLDVASTHLTPQKRQNLAEHVAFFNDLLTEKLSLQEVLSKINLRFENSNISTREALDIACHFIGVSNLVDDLQFVWNGWVQRPHHLLHTY